MKAPHLIALIAALALPAVAFAAKDAEALFAKSGCSYCHKPDRKSLGPSLKDIAARYAGNKSAPATLLKKVRNGGSGVWGAMPMPGTPDRVSDNDIRAILAWVLARK
jgi:cytochrome c